LSNPINDFLVASQNVELDTSVVSKLNSQIIASEISKRTGEANSENPSGNLSFPYLFHLNVTRFGTITLASIAIGILIPLYRFSEKLSAFYRSRSDALRLNQLDRYKRIGLEKLSTVVAPGIDYGKSQNVPDKLTEILGLIRKPEKDGDET
jgi:hypothetical protein